MKRSKTMVNVAVSAAKVILPTRISTNILWWLGVASRYVFTKKSAVVKRSETLRLALFVEGAMSQEGFRKMLTQRPQQGKGSYKKLDEVISEVKRRAYAVLAR